MSRALVFLGLILVGSAVYAQDALIARPRWSVSPAPSVIEPGKPFEQKITFVVPQGYYQDADSSFFHLEVTPPFQLLSQSHPPTVRRELKDAWTGTVHFTMKVVLPPDRVASLMTWNCSWQICLLDGICLLPTSSSLQQSVTTGSSGGDQDFWLALWGAFLGGILLNVMPCVFPVLALKAIGLTSIAALERRRRRREAWLFALGGLGFLTLIGLVTAGLAVAGQRLDWGFTFQQPLFVWVLSLTFWIFSLQLFGVWEWSGSPFALTISRDSWFRPLWGGAFLVVTAAPCTAPLLGPALGYAFTLPPWLIPLFFISVGMGLIVPLLLLSLWPSLVRWIPRPGRWMIGAQKIAAVPLAATALYLAWVVAQQVGNQMWYFWIAVILVLGLFLALRSRPRLTRFHGVITLLGLFVVLSLTAVALGRQQNHPISRPLPAGWDNFSQDRLDSASVNGPVFVDATAAWCATCQVNEATVLLAPEVRKIFQSQNVILLRADYTLPDSEIKRWLDSVHRAGLPVYVLYRPGESPYLFSELLTAENFTRVLPRLLKEHLPSATALDGTKLIR